MEEVSLKKKVWDYYCDNYKVLLIIPSVVLLLALISIGIHIGTTGDFLNKDVSLKGGVTLTLPLSDPPDNKQVEQQLQEVFPQYDILVRDFGVVGTSQGLVIEANLEVNNEDEVNTFLAEVENVLSLSLDDLNAGVEFFGSSLGASFFRESLWVLLIAFLFMAGVVFVYFRNFIPSIAIVLAALSDMIVALAVINLMGIEIGTAGIAAFLMLIGYSVDTDILLTVRVLKRREGTLNDRILSSIKTGLTQTGTSLVAIGIALIFTQSEVVRQIMIILFVGLLADLIFTWLQNVGLLRYYFERKEKADEL